LLFINIASAFIMPLPSVSHINKLPVKVNCYRNNNNKCLNIYYPQSFIYSFILYNLTLFLISKLKDDTPE